MPSPQTVPGSPSSQAPDLHEPVTPRQPLPPKDDQRQPETRTVVGAEEKLEGNGRGQRGEYLTTATGTSLLDLLRSYGSGTFRHPRCASRVVEKRPSSDSTNNTRCRGKRLVHCFGHCAH